MLASKEYRILLLKENFGLKTSNVAQPPYLIGGETEAWREASNKGPQRVHGRAGLSAWSPGSLSAV